MPAGLASTFPVVLADTNYIIQQKTPDPCKAGEYVPATVMRVFLVERPRHILCISQPQANKELERLCSFPLSVMSQGEN